MKENLILIVVDLAPNAKLEKRVILPLIVNLEFVRVLESPHAKRQHVATEFKTETKLLLIVEEIRAVLAPIF